MFTYMIVVNDNGELKSISQEELAAGMPTDPEGLPAFEEALDMILDNRVPQDELQAAYDRLNDIPDPEKNFD